MNRTRFLALATTLALALILASFTGGRTWAQAQGSQVSPQATADQQKQLDQLDQLEVQLEKDRTALHEAIAKYGWDSDQTDSAQDQLLRDRQLYRKLRRSLRQAGVTVPAGQGFAPCPDCPGPYGRSGRMGRGGPGMYRHYGMCYGGGMGCCPCCGR